MQCVSIFGSTALSSGETGAIFCNGSGDTAGVRTSSVTCMMETETASPPKKHTATGHFVWPVRRGSVNGTHVAIGVLRGSASPPVQLHFKCLHPSLAALT